MPRSRFVITYLLKYRLNVDVRASAHVTGQLIVKGNIFLNDSGWYTKFFLFSSFGYRGTCVPVSQEQCGTSLRRDEENIRFDNFLLGVYADGAKPR